MNDIANNNTAEAFLKDFIEKQMSDRRRRYSTVARSTPEKAPELQAEYPI